MDLPFMRTALARQGNRGLPEVRNPTWRVEGTDSAVDECLWDLASIENRRLTET
jgi:hypothetical protein